MELCHGPSETRKDACAVVPDGVVIWLVPSSSSSSHGQIFTCSNHFEWLALEWMVCAETEKGPWRDVLHLE